MPKIDKKLKEYATIASVGVAVALAVFGAFAGGATAVLDDYVFLAIIILISPLAILSYIDFRWRKGVDEHLPELFHSIVDAQETGMTLPKAIEEATKRNYGPLTPELKRMAVQMSWGASFEEALLAFENRVGTVLTQRTVPMIIEASRSGGRVEKIFDPMGKFVQTTLLLEKERKTQTRPYIAIIYIALFVFLFTIVLLFKTFFSTIEGVPALVTTTSSPSDLERTFFHLTLIQSFFGGLVAGKMGEGTITAGLKHSLIMMILGYFALRLFL